MTDKEILKAFRSEIERLKDSCASPIVICDTLLSLIDSMQEEPVSRTPADIEVAMEHDYAKVSFIKED